MKVPGVPGLDVCPSCGHSTEEHPLDERTGTRYCSRSVTEPPSCNVCRDQIRRLLHKRGIPATGARRGTHPTDWMMG